MAGAAVVLGRAMSEAERASLFAIVAEKMRQACFIDWCVGVVLLAFYGTKMYAGGEWVASDLWPAIVALGITRVGNTVQKCVADCAYWLWHKPGEADNA